MSLSNAPIEPEDGDDNCDEGTAGENVPRKPIGTAGSTVKPLPTNDIWDDNDGLGTLTEANAPAFDNPLTAGEFLDIAPPKLSPIIPGISAKRRNTVFRAGRGVDANMLGQMFGHRSTIAKTFPPFGQVSPVVTYLAFNSVNWELVHERMFLFDDQVAGTPYRNTSRKKLAMISRTDRTGRTAFLNQPSDKVRFLAGIPADCELVVIVDPDAWHNDNQKNSQPAVLSYPSLLTELNQRGIATVSIFLAGKGGPSPLFTQLAQDERNSLAEFEDVGKARQYGGSYQVTRRCMSEHETVPRHFRMSYTTVGGVLKIGWECTDPTDGTSIKQLEMVERERVVELCLDQGMKQIEIAKIKNMSQSMVCRCVANIKRGRKRAAGDGKAAK